MAIMTMEAWFKMFVGDEYDFQANKKFCCIFHEENTPSMAYWSNNDTITCFGRCGRSWNVVQAHKQKFGFDNDEEAERDLKLRLGISTEKEYVKSIPTVTVQEHKLKYAMAYNKAVNLAQNKEQWLKLDYIMSMHRGELEMAEDLEIFNREEGAHLYDRVSKRPY